MMPEHSEPGRARALGLRLAAAVEIELEFVSELLVDRRGNLLDQIRTTADRLLTRGDERSCDLEVQDLIVWIRQQFPEHPQEAEQVLFEAAQRFIERIGSARCAAMASLPDGARPCCGGLCEVVKVRDFVDQRIKALYERHAHGGAMPPLEFVTKGVAASARHAYFPQFRVNGWTEVVDGPAPVVGLEFQDRGLDFATLCQSLYVLMHEMVCHAYQSLDDPERENPDDICSWSDGWMDALAWQLTENYLDLDADLPPWLSTHPEDTKRVCKALHDRRFDEPATQPLTPADLNERINARRAFLRLRRLWAGANASPSTVDEAVGVRIVEFSVLLNHCRLSQDERTQLVSLLKAGLLSRDLDKEVAGVCSVFCKERNPYALRDQLRVLVNGFSH